MCRESDPPYYWRSYEQQTSFFIQLPVRIAGKGEPGFVAMLKARNLKLVAGGKTSELFV